MPAQSHRLDSHRPDSRRPPAPGRLPPLVAGLLLGAFLLSAAGCAPDPEGPTGRAAALDPQEMQEIEGEVRLALEHYADRVDARDWPAVAAFYVDGPDFLWVEDGRLAYSSRGEVAGALQELGQMFSEVDLELTETRVSVLGPGAAAVSTLYRQTLGAVELEPGAEVGEPEDPFVLEGAITAVMVERGESWLFLQGHTSTRTGVEER